MLVEELEVNSLLDQGVQERGQEDQRSYGTSIELVLTWAKAPLRALVPAYQINIE
jgi:hypothetical protein